MPENDNSQPIRVAIGFGATIPPLSSLLQRQREEEPESAVQVSGVTSSELARGLLLGCYDLGFSADSPVDARLSALVLWQEEVAVALPARSPLLVHVELSLEEVANYPIVMWCPKACDALSRKVMQLLESTKKGLHIVQYVQSFELMVVLVAAGYGVALCGRTQIAASRELGVVMRPLQRPVDCLSTYMVRSRERPCERIDRLARRAQSICWP